MEFKWARAGFPKAPCAVSQAAVVRLTSHRWPTMGASAQECSAFMPILLFLKTTKVMDLSNHLQGDNMIMGFQG